MAVELGQIVMVAQKFGQLPALRPGGPRSVGRSQPRVIHNYFNRLRQSWLAAIRGLSAVARSLRARSKLRSSPRCIGRKPSP
ncbi:hypothetical protein M2324_000066 [Rhodovulum sulfidophilum]|nr:hypothetical protein [Rhodovulum sulfidophilum]